MSDAFTGEIRLFAIAYAPTDWALCDGSLHRVAENQALYSIIGNMYGGTPGQTFNLPNFLGRSCVGAGQGPGLSLYRPGDHGGETSVALTGSQMPAHQHTVQHYGVPYANKVAAPAANTYLGAFDLSSSQTADVFAPGSTPPSTTLAAATLSPFGGGPGGFAAAHENRQPFQVVNFFICTYGYYPVRP
jgi:microcystin-dependent protein